MECFPTIIVDQQQIGNMVSACFDQITGAQSDSLVDHIRLNIQKASLSGNPLVYWIEFAKNSNKLFCTYGNLKPNTYASLSGCQLCRRTGLFSVDPPRVGERLTRNPRGGSLPHTHLPLHWTGWGKHWTALYSSTSSGMDYILLREKYLAFIANRSG